MRFGGKSLGKFVFSAATLALSAGTYAQTCVQTRDIYTFTATINPGGSCGIFGGSSSQALFNALTTQGLRSLPPQLSVYNGNQGLDIAGRYNAVPFNAQFALPGQPNLNFNAPFLGVNNQSFIGASRDQSVALLQSFLASSGINSRVMRFQIANSPNSPIAGPGGLIPNMVASSFDDNLSHAASHIAAPTSFATADGQPSNQNLIGIGLSYSLMRVQDSNNGLATLPLSYTMRNDLDPRRQLVFSLPLTRLNTDGSISYGGGLGAAYRIPMNDSWTLTPSAKVAMTSARDLNTLVSVASATMTSNYIWVRDSFDISMANQIGYYQSVKLFGGDYSGNPDVRSVALRNGLMLTQPASVFGQKMSLEFALIDTRYMGTKFYVDNTQELSVTLGTNKRAYSARSFYRGGLTFLNGRETKGITANIGYWF